MSQTYNQVLSIDVVYENLPQNKIFNQKPISTIDVEIQATGFRIFTSGFSQGKIKFSLANLTKKNNGKYYLLTNLKSNKIDKQLSSGLNFKTVVQDTIHFDLGDLETKKVPVIPDLSVNYELGFDTRKITVSPDSVLISGTEDILKDINQVKLKPLTLTNVSENYKSNLDILLPNKKVKISHNKVSLSIDVDKYTEGEFDIPVMIKNATEKITIYPKKVKIIFKISLKDFNKVTEDSFEVIADYKYTKENKLSYLLPKLKVKPKIISSVRIVPEKVDFLISK